MQIYRFANEIIKKEICTVFLSVKVVYEWRTVNLMSVLTIWIFFS